MREMALLVRCAEGLFWLARHVDRVENQAGLL